MSSNEAIRLMQAQLFQYELLKKMSINRTVCCQLSITGTNNQPLFFRNLYLNILKTPDKRNSLHLPAEVLVK